MMQPAYPIYLLRHGQTEWNAARRMQGGLDSPLTEKGVRQARNMGATLAKRLQNTEWDLVASPLGRAACTAGFVAALTELPLRFDDRLREITLGEWDGWLVDEVEERFPGTTSWVGWHFSCPGGETFAELAARAGAWLKSISQPTIAVSHGVFGRMARGLYTGEDSLEAVGTSHASQDGIYLLHNGAVEFIECIEHGS